MSIRRMMLFTLGAKIKNLIDAFKTRVFANFGIFEAESCLEAQLTQLDNQNLLDSASLVVTPNGYKETLLYAVEPNEVGTNLLLRSEEFDNASIWQNQILGTGVNPIRIANAAISPDGTQNADRITFNRGAGNTITDQSVINQQITISTAGTYIFSVWLKASASEDVGKQVFIRCGNGSPLLAVTLTASWVRFQISASVTASSNSFQIGSRGTFTLNNIVTADIWGAQLVPGSTITNYIPTTDRVIINGTIGDMSVTRATTATRVNADGFIEVVPYNLLSQSQNFENVFWAKQRTTIGQNVILAPDGTLTADNLIANSGVTYDYIGVNGVNIVSNSFLLNTDQRTLSFYLKYNGLNRIRVMYATATSLGGAVFVEVDLQLGIITTSNGGIVASNFFIEDAGNGWYRVGFNLITTLSTTNNRFAVGLGDTVKTIANGVDGVYLWGAQLVDGSLAKDYFPTTNRFNIPRIDYSNGSCPSVLVEPQRTNVLIRSEELNITPWSSAGINVTPNTIISPSGLLNADTITGDGNLTLHQTFQTNISYVSGSTYTFSVYVKKGTNDFIQISLPNNTFFSLRFANFDINTGVIGNVSAGVTASILNAGNGWYRCIVTSTASATITSTISLVLITSSTSIRNENNSLNTSVNVWGAQLEVGTNATSYIPTVASTVTRNADLITNTNVSTLIGQTEGTFFIDFKLQAQSFNDNVVRTLGTLHAGSNANRIQIYRLNNQLLLLIITSGINQVALPLSITTFTGQTIKIAVSYSLNNVKLFVNGVLVSTDTSATIPLCNSFNLGSNALSSDFYNGLINSALIFKTQLTDTQCINLTTL
jgi:hypothetical protein